MPRVTKTEYIPISPLVLRPDTKGPFDIFLKNEGNYVLFNGQGRLFSKRKRQELAENSVTAIYIDKKSLSLYRAYIQDNLKDVLDDDSIPLDERAQAWANSATSLGKELFEANLPGPAFEKRYKRFERLISNSAGFLQSPQPLKHLSKFIGKGFRTYHHGISTMVYAVNLMQEYTKDEYEVLTCGMGALLHDIGKLGLPEEITEQNPALLSDEDRDILRLHPMIGVRNCASFNLPVVASNCILFHHERADGGGYPTQAMADELPLPTKVVALCNAYDNLTRIQPYRRPLKPFDALKAIMEDDGMVEQHMLKKFVELLSRAEIV